MAKLAWQNWHGKIDMAKLAIQVLGCNIQEHFPIMAQKFKYMSKTRCLKITEKVSFNIASEASYVYILSGQKFFNKNY